jgi:hypothetical protein
MLQLRSWHYKFQIIWDSWVFSKRLIGSLTSKRVTQFIELHKFATKTCGCLQRWVFIRFCSWLDKLWVFGDIKNLLSLFDYVFMWRHDMSSEAQNKCLPDCHMTCLTCHQMSRRHVSVRKTFVATSWHVETFHDMPWHLVLCHDKCGHVSPMLLVAWHGSCHNKSVTFTCLGNMWATFPT